MSLKQYAQLLPKTYHYLAASCFSIFNQPKAAASIFDAARKDLVLKLVEARQESSKIVRSELHLARQFREALLRAGIFGGMSKAINVGFIHVLSRHLLIQQSLQELHKVMPDSLREREDPSPGDSYSDLLSRGRGFLNDVYGSGQARNIEGALYGLSPRLGYYSVPLVYGGVYADTTALSVREACVLMFLCNMAVDTPKQAIGHIDSSRRQGVPKDDLLHVGIMVRSIAEMYGIKLTTWESIMETVDADQQNDKNPYEI